VKIGYKKPGEKVGEKLTANQQKNNTNAKGKPGHHRKRTDEPLY